MKSIHSKTVVFIHGAFVHYSGWDNWKTYFESKGYKTLAPPWPEKEDEPEFLRSKHPNSPIASLRLMQVINHFDAIVKSLPEKPIIIGHSLGGLITQVLVNRGLSAAGICIHPVPPQGVIPYEFSFLKSGWGALGLFTSTKKDYLMPFSTWQYAFTNGMSLADQREAYEKSVVPESKMVTRDGLSSDTYVDFKKPHPPMLFIAGTADHIMPATLTRRIFKKYTPYKDSVTELKEYINYNHFAVASRQHWKEYADYVLNWISAH
ncbi:MAG: alpha/beta hydrolase [Saprospiraceae bacterium]|nr:alpha/beta hydrolase [Saprospiraceae bacterium]